MRWSVININRSIKSRIALCAIVAFLLGPALGQEALIRGRVVGVTDGDTLKVLVSEQQLLRIRLAFCDAPEKQQAFGQRAKQAMSALVFGKDVVLRQQTIDRYGRTVALVGVDGKDVGGEMRSQGLAWIYDRYIGILAPCTMARRKGANTCLKSRPPKADTCQPTEPAIDAG